MLKVYTGCNTVLESKLGKRAGGREGWGAIARCQEQWFVSPGVVQELLVLGTQKR